LTPGPPGGRNRTVGLRPGQKKKHDKKGASRRLIVCGKKTALKRGLEGPEVTKTVRGQMGESKKRQKR